MSISLRVYYRLSFTVLRISGSQICKILEKINTMHYKKNVGYQFEFFEQGIILK